MANCKISICAVMLLFGCVQPEDFNPAQGTCVGSVPYAGANLREGLDATRLRLASAPRSRLSRDVHTQLSAAFHTARGAMSAETLTAAVWQAGGSPWAMQVGAEPGRLHYWASVGKIVTATAILQLEHAGKLSLDDQIARYVSGVPSGDAITLRMLLSHTSGLFSLNEDPRYRATGVMELPEVLEALDHTTPYACPGAHWRYSNTGYTLLGAVIEAVTGQSYAHAVQNLVLSRSAARNITVLSPEAGLSNVVPVAKLAGAPRFDIRAPQAAGGIVADAESMAVFLRDLLAGRILPTASVLRMTHTLYPMFDQGLWYGLGLMVYDVPTSNGTRVWVGHSGGVPGAKAVVAYAPDLNAIAAVALTGEGSAEATANLLFKALEKPK